MAGRGRRGRMGCGQGVFRCRKRLAFTQSDGLVWGVGAGPRNGRGAACRRRGSLLPEARSPVAALAPLPAGPAKDALAAFGDTLVARTS